MTPLPTDCSTTLLSCARRPNDPATLAFAGVIDQALRASRQPLIRGLSESCFQQLLKEFFSGLSCANGERCAAPQATAAGAARSPQTR